MTIHTTDEERACELCGEVLDEDAIAMGWPISTATTGLGEPALACPSCYGDEAFCAEGHVLPAHSDTTECQRCEASR